MPKPVSFLKKQEKTKINSHATLLRLLIQCLHCGAGTGSFAMIVYSMLLYGTDVGSYNMVIYSIPIL
jgi:hypothetical protein